MSVSEKPISILYSYLNNLNGYDVIQIVLYIDLMNLQLQQNDLLGLDDDEVDAVTLLPPKMTLNFVSSHVLQLTVSKTFLEVVGSLAKVSFKLFWISVFDSNRF